ncbi:HNH endonuclease [Agrobacterium tumefaciens]|nr:HNH endonuclease [Agrobacterium tumefaciens]
MIEETKICPGFPSYSISESGVITRISPGKQKWSLPGRIIKHEITKDGHHRVTLFEDGKRSRAMVHRLVCEAWHGAPPVDRPLSCHRDDDKDNNHFTNLYWGTHKENGEDSHRNGRSVRGERVNTAKLKEIEVIEIRERAYRGETNISLAAAFGVPDAAISMIVRGRQWKHVGGPIVPQSRRGRPRQNFSHANDNTPTPGATITAD